MVPSVMATCAPVRSASSLVDGLASWRPPPVESSTGPSAGPEDGRGTLRAIDYLRMSDMRHIRPGDRVEGDPTPGMHREQAIASEGMWAGVVHTDAGMVSGWHHHGDHESSIYVADGALRMEYGPGGASVIDARAGDFIHVPRFEVHRERNPTDAVSTLVVVRAGRGVPTVNVDGPETRGDRQ